MACGCGRRAERAGKRTIQASDRKATSQAQRPAVWAGKRTQKEKPDGG